MAKPPVDTFEKMIGFIQKQVRGKKFVKNYQPVMIKFLLQNGTQSRQQIANELRLKNINEKPPSGGYGRVPVYGVLEKNGIVTKKGEMFSLVLQNITEEQKQSLFDVIDSSITRHTDFVKTGYLSFKEAKVVVRELAIKYNLKNSGDWSNFAKSDNKPDNIPASPASYYKKRNSRRI
jgi:hypothetical protein